MIRVYLLDDHELIRKGLRQFLATAPDVTVVGEGGTIREAIEDIPVLEPDVAVLDIRLPDGSGVDVCRFLSEKVPPTRCLMLSSFGEDGPLFDAIDAGAAGYILKETRGPELVEAIRKIAAGDSLIDRNLTGHVLDRIRSGVKADPLEKLSPQEKRIFGLVGDGLTNREIASELGLAEQTIKNYVSVLLTKLDLERRAQAAAMAARLKEQGRSS